MQQEILREYVGPAAVPYLLRALAAPPTSDHGVDVQGVAAQLLGEWRVKEAVPLLIDLMHRARLWSLRGTAAIALGEIGSPEAVDALIAAADLQQDAELLASVADALGYLRDARAEAALMKLLQHPDAKVRYAAAKAIESSGTFRILPELEQRADQETVESVRRALVQAIERIRGQ
jgi:HEAT repeat protein